MGDTGVADEQGANFDDAILGDDLDFTKALPVSLAAGRALEDSMLAFPPCDPVGSRVDEDEPKITGLNVFFVLRNRKLSAAKSLLGARETLSKDEMADLTDQARNEYASMSKPDRKALVAEHVRSQAAPPAEAAADTRKTPTGLWGGRLPSCATVGT